MLAGPGWGWHIETAVHVIRLDPRRRIRPISEIANRHRPHGRRAALHVAAARRHAAGDDETCSVRSAPICAKISITRSAASISRRPSSICCLRSGVDRIMFSADHPYQSMAQARAFLDQLPVSTADKERIAHGNAETAFHVVGLLTAAAGDGGFFARAADLVPRAEPDQTWIKPCELIITELCRHHLCP